MGPLVTRVHRDKVAGYVDAGVAEGADLLVDGREVQADGAADGFWLGPTLFDNVTPEMSIYTDEIFGPVQSVIPVPMAYYSFGGWKASLFGDTHAHGAEGFHFFTRGKVVTSRWPDPAHGGINLGFPTHG